MIQDFETNNKDKIDSAIKSKFSSGDGMQMFVIGLG
jgi:hypothetical protein